MQIDKLYRIITYLPCFKYRKQAMKALFPAI
jgi:hypothetical protein